MADEATIRSSLQIAVGNLTYLSQPTAFTADVSAAGGPTPGMINVPVSGVNIDLSELTQPGLMRLMNLDATNFVTLGVYDGANFFPVLELLPGETYVARCSRYLNEEFIGTGTGTDADVNFLRLAADTAACKVLVEAFET